MVKNRKLFVVGIVLLLSVELSACIPLRSDKGDILVTKLRIGMSPEEVQEILGDPKTVLYLDKFRYLFYLQDRYPYDLFTKVPEKASCWAYVYPAGSMNNGTLCIFPDSDGRVAGWFKDHSELSRDKFMHEKLTSQLKADILGRGMTHAEVYARIGRPEAVVNLPRHRTPEFYEDRYWTRDALNGIYKNMEVYSYLLVEGQKRHVFLIYATQADKLHVWGYDHAWEEAERYLAEQAAKKKQ